MSDAEAETQDITIPLSAEDPEPTVEETVDQEEEAEEIPVETEPTDEPQEAAEEDDGSSLEFNFREMLWDKFDITESRILDGKKTIKSVIAYGHFLEQLCERFGKDLQLTGKSFAKESIPDKCGTFEPAFDSMRDEMLALTGALGEVSAAIKERIDTPLTQLKRRLKVEHERMKKEEDRVGKEKKIVLAAFRKAEAASRKAAEDADKAEDACNQENNEPGQVPTVLARLSEKAAKTHRVRLKADETHQEKADAAVSRQVQYAEIMGQLFDVAQGLDVERLTEVKAAIEALANAEISLGKRITESGMRMQKAAEAMDPVAEVGAFVKEHRSDAAPEALVKYAKQESGITITPLAPRPEPAAAPVIDMEDIQETEQPGQTPTQPADTQPTQPTSEDGVEVVALFDYQAGEPAELTIAAGDRLTALDGLDGPWWKCRAASGEEGLVPGNYLKKAGGEETGTVLYDFDGGDDGTMTVKEGDVIVVLSNDGDWIQASKDGEVGLVPTNYVQL